MHRAGFLLCAERIKMKNSSYFNERIIRDTISILKPNNELFEIRIIGKSGNKKRIISGYFTDADTLINAFDTIDPRGVNIYITVNGVKSECYSREQHDCFRITDSTTHDHEVSAYEWLFIDLDPIRLAEISSSSDELLAAKDLSKDVADYMSNLGFSEPVIAISGNGYHLLYKINLPNNEENKALIGRCLAVLADQFNTDMVKIDEVNHNQSRICKLYGTMAQKGANTKERPHRMSEIISAPSDPKVNDKDLLLKLAGELPELPQRQKTNTSTGQFDIENWMRDFGVEYIRKDTTQRAVIYPLAYCPFDSSHTNGDAKIFSYYGEGIAFKCHHNSCRGKTWQDVREKFEPDAYVPDNIDAVIEEGWKKHKQQYLTVQKTDDIEAVKKNLPKLVPISAHDLQQKVFDEKYYAVKDMIPEGETVIAAPPKTGKSWLVLNMCLKIAEGKNFLNFETTASDALYMALEDGDSFEQERLNIVLDGEPAPKNFHFVFSNVMPMNEGFLIQLDELLKLYPNVKIVIIDTLNFIKYRQGKSESAYECDYRTGRDLKQYAEEHKIAIVVVTHTTKMVHVEDDMANVSGTNGVTGAADSVIVISKKQRTDLDAKLFITGRKVRQATHNIKFDNDKCVWQYVGVAETGNKDEIERKEKEDEYFNSQIRDVVVRISRDNFESGVIWKGHANDIIAEAVKMGIGLKESKKQIGGFVSQMQGYFMAFDNVQVEVVKRSGSNANSYAIYPSEVEENPFG